MINESPRQVLLLAGAVSVLCLVFFLWIFFSSRTKPTPPPVTNTVPTATLVPLLIPTEYIAKNDVPAYLGSTPKNSDNNVNLFESFFVDFDREIARESFKIFLTPATPFQALKDGSTLELKPATHWRAGTDYRVSIIENYSNREIVNLKFATMQDTYTPPGDTAPLPKYIIDDTENTKKISPSTFLMNIVPYENDFIIISGDYDDTIKDFVFLVKSKNNDINEAKIEVQKFFGELGLTAELVKKLQIDYQ